MACPQRILIIGNGGRECALGNAILLSPGIAELYVAPANWSIVDLYARSASPTRVRTLELKPTDADGIRSAALEHSIELAIIGPEAPLVAGLADELRAAGIPTLGPGLQAAKLEGSKLYAKEFMLRHGIPTASHKVFEDADALIGYCKELEGPIVLKADGLAAGKGVIVCKDRDDASAGATRLMIEREFGDAGDVVLAEERLYGDEISWTCLIAGPHDAQLLAASTDYKPLLDDHEGPNTGGMGNICPTPFASPAVTQEFQEKIFTPLLNGLETDGLDYRGFLFIGTMLTDEGLKVLEFNVRIGDPEAQAIMPLLSAEWPEVFAGVAAGALAQHAIQHADGACVAVVAASKNYPYGKSEPAAIEGLDRVHARGLLAGQEQTDGRMAPPPISIYFAGVGRQALAEANISQPSEYHNYYDDLAQAQFVASGGRVLALSAVGSDLSDARRLAYEVLGNIRFEGMKFRSDIGKLR